MPATPIYALPYPGTGDSPHGPNQLQALAAAVETLIAAMKPVTDKFATGGTVSSTQSTSGTTTSFTFVETLTGGTPCSAAFVAPPSGMVMVFNNALLDNSSTTQTSICSWIIRNGSTIGSGTTFLDAGDDGSLWMVGTDDQRRGTSQLVTGLTPGASYNIRQQFRVSGGATATYSRKHLAVLPLAF